MLTSESETSPSAAATTLCGVAPSSCTLSASKAAKLEQQLEEVKTLAAKLQQQLEETKTQQESAALEQENAALKQQVEIAEFKHLLAEKNAELKQQSVEKEYLKGQLASERKLHEQFCDRQFEMLQLFMDHLATEGDKNRAHSSETLQTVVGGFAAALQTVVGGFAAELDKTRAHFAAESDKNRADSLPRATRLVPIVLALSTR